MNTTFFTACNAPYWPFVVPYATAVLIHNDDSMVEICVEDASLFQREHGRSLQLVSEAFPDRVLIREGSFKGTIPNSVRFLETPLTRTEFTYIGDVDILILDNDITSVHAAHMGRTGLPYSNCVRSGTRRLTGLHFTRTDAHYPLRVPSDLDLKGNDEELLFRLVVEKGLVLPDPLEAFRPVHGIHLSLARAPCPSPNGRPHWGLTAHYARRYRDLWSNPVWAEVVPLLHPSFRWLLLVLEAALQAKNPDIEIYRWRETKNLWKTFSDMPRGSWTPG